MKNLLPHDLQDALLVGRIWRNNIGPCIVVVREGFVFDITAKVVTVSDLFDKPDLLTFVRSVDGENLGPVVNWMETGAFNGSHLLVPCDLQAIKACGVTFAVSLLERVIEERAKGDPTLAAEIRQGIQELIGSNLSAIRPGSINAMRLKEELVSRGMWSQYMEVGIGPDAEVFTKAQPMSAVGHCMPVGIHPSSDWNNPEPEIVLAVNSRGELVGATLGNDVNLRDVEGRSALLLGKAKDNNASCAIGPFVRLIDDNFNLDNICEAKVNLRIEGKDDGFELDGVSEMSEISRDPLDLIRQTYGSHHQYPDGFMLFLGTMFSPTKDRGAEGRGFTHKVGDLVHISSPQIGTLKNSVERCDTLAPWSFGVRSLFRNLGERGLFPSSDSTKS